MAVLLALIGWLLLFTNQAKSEEETKPNATFSPIVQPSPPEPTVPERSPVRKNPNPIRGTHNIRAAGTISEESLHGYLASKGSPLAPFSAKILEFPYWSTIIAICTIEEYSCKVNPHGTNNLWGLMSGGHLIHYPTLGDGIDAIAAFLAKAEGNGRSTIESFRGWYCASECTNWESTVIKTKENVEIYDFNILP